MAQRDLGTAVLNIKILFDKLDKAQLTKQVNEVTTQINKSLDEARLQSNKIISDLNKTVAAAALGFARSKGHSDKQIQYNFAGGPAKDALQAGKDVVEGFNKGLIEFAPKTAKAIAKWLNSFVIKPTKDTLKTKSPSRVFLKIGTDIIAGLILGIEQAAGPAKAAMRKYLSEITNVTDTVATLKNQINTINLLPTKSAEDLQALARLQAALEQAENKLKSLKKQARSDPRLFDLPKEELALLKKQEQARERAAASLQKQAGGIRSVVADINAYHETLKTAGRNTKSMAAMVDASSGSFSKFFSKIVSGSQKTKDYAAAQQALDASFKKLSQRIGATIPQGKLKQQVLAALKVEATKAKDAVLELAAAEAKQQAASRETADAGLKRKAALILAVTQRIKDLFAAEQKGEQSAKSRQSTESAISTLIKKRLTAEVALIAKTYDSIEAQKQLKQVLDDIDKELKSSGLSADQYARSLAALTNAETAARGQLSKLSFQQDIGVQLRRAESAGSKADIRRIILALQQVKETLKQAGANTTHLDQALIKASKSLDQLNRAKLANLRRSIHSVTSGVNQFGEQLRRVSFILRDVGRQMMTISQRSFGFLKPIVEDFAAFEQSVVDILAIAGELNTGLVKVDAVGSQLGQTILNLAGQFSFSAEEIAEVAKQLALSGFNLDQIQRSLASVLRLAAATGSELSVAANIVVSSMATFGLSAEAATRVADIFAVTVTRANTNLSQLGEGFKIVAPVAAATGQSIEQVAAALGNLANSGLRGTLAGTGLARILTQLPEKAGKLDAILKSVGSSFAAIDPERVDFSDIIAEFERLNLSTATLATTLDLRAFRALSALLAQGAASLESMNENLERAQGIAKAISFARLNTLAASLQLTADAFNALKITLGSLVSKEINTFVAVIRNLIIDIKNFIQENVKEVSILVKLVGSVTAAIGTMGAALFSAGSAAAFASAPIITLGAVLAGLSTIATAVMTAMTTFGLAAGSALSIVLPVVISLGAAIYGFGAAVGSVFAAVTVSVATATDLWGKFFTDLGHKITYIFNVVLLPIYRGFLSQSGLIRGATEELLAALLDLFDTGFARKANWEDVGKGLASGLASFLRVLADLIRYVTPALQKIGEGLLGIVVILSNPTFQSFLSWIMTAIDALNRLRQSVDAVHHAWWALGLVSQPPTRQADSQINRMAKAIEDLQQYQSEIAKTVLEVQEYADSLERLGPILSDIASAKPVELRRFIDTESSKASRETALLDIEKELNKLKTLRAGAEAIAKLDDLNPMEAISLQQGLSGINARIADLERAKDSIENIGKQLDTINEIVAGQTQDQIQANLAQAISRESAKLAEVRSVVSDITELSMLTQNNYKATDAEIEALRQRLESLLGVSVELDAANPVNSLVNNIRTTLADLEKEGQSQLKIYQDLIKILPKLEGVDLSTKAGRQALADLFTEYNTILENLQNFDAVEEAAKKVQEELAKIGKTEHEIRLEQIEAESEARKAALAEYEQQLKNKQTMLSAEISSDRMFGKDTAQKEKELQETEAALREAQAMSGPGGAVDQDKERQRAEELAKEEERRQKAAEDAELERLKLRLESEDALDDRIAIRQRMAEISRNREREDMLRTNAKVTADAIERAKREAEIRRESEEALAREKEEIAKEERDRQADKEESEEDLAKKRLESELELSKLKLDSEENIQNRIALRQRIAEIESERAREKMLADFKATKPTDWDLAAFEADLQASSDAALEAEKRKIVDEEMKGKPAQDRQKAVDKRLDLETELLTTFGKQVQTLAQMAQLMRLIEILQIRKDRRALKDAKNLAKEEAKLAAMEANAINLRPGVLEAKRLEVAVLKGIFSRNMGVAGVAAGMGGMFDINAFFANLSARMVNFTKEMKPMLLDARFDIEKLKTDLENGLKGFKIEGVLAGIIPGGLNVGNNAKLVGANFGVINHIDNSTTTVKVGQMDRNLAMELGLL